MRLARRGVLPENLQSKSHVITLPLLYHSVLIGDRPRSKILKFYVQDYESKCIRAQLNALTSFYGSLTPLSFVVEIFISQNRGFRILFLSPSRHLPLLFS